MTTDSAPRQSRLPLLRQWYAKMAYIIASVAIYYLGGGLAPTDLTRGILRSVLVFVLVLLATRVFRSAVETDSRPRAWWRMTGRPRAGYVLGSLLGLVTISLVLWLAGVESRQSFQPVRVDEPYVVVTVVLCAALAVLYLTSSVRLRSLEREAAAEAARSRKPETRRSGSTG